MRPTGAQQCHFMYVVLKAGNANNLCLEIRIAVALCKVVAGHEHRSLWDGGHVLCIDLDVGYTCVCVIGGK